MAKKQVNKKSRGAIAAALAVSLLVSGTFAWQSFYQGVRNQTQGIDGAPGVRLHDDFDGENKDVYAENYLEEEYGGMEAIVRIRLDEYMEIGSGAGDFDDTTRPITVLRGDYAKQGNPEVTFENKSSWDTYVLHKDSGFVEIDPTNTIREYRELEFGGTTVYMPTFNKNNQDLSSDINGTIDGLDGDRDTQRYDDYVQYALDTMEVVEGNQEVLVTQETDDQVYYLEDGATIPDHTDESGNPLQTRNNGNNTYSVLDVTHQTKETLTSDYAGEEVEVISMEDWLALGLAQKSGNYWVYDVDGWAYWASPLQAEEATSLLLTGIEVVSQPLGTSFYYAVNVVGQFASALDLGDPNGASDEEKGMYASITENAKLLINRVATELEMDFAMTDENGTAHTTTRFDQQASTTSVYGALINIEDAEIADQQVVWTLYDSNSQEVTTEGVMTPQAGSSYPEGGVLNTVSLNTTNLTPGETYVLRATSVADSKKYVNYYIQVYDLADEETFTITLSAQGYNEGETISLESPATLQFSSIVEGFFDTTTNWYVTGGAGTSSISSSGLLTIEEGEETTLTVKVEANANPGLYKTLEVGVTVPPPSFDNVEPGSTETVERDGVDWYVLARETVMTYDEDGNEEGEVEATLIWASQFVEMPDAQGSYEYRTQFHTSNVSNWGTSLMQTTYLPNWLESTTSLKDVALRVKNVTDGYYTTNTQTVGSGGATTYTTYDKVTLLSQPEWLEYVGSGTVLAKNDTIESASNSWLRSPYNSTRVRIVGGSTGALYDVDVASYTGGVRPALWVPSSISDL